MRTPTLSDRTSGILLHPTSLPGPHGSGDLGPAAIRFVDFLARARQSFWQMLPVGPVGFGNSPYSALSAFAGEPLLVSLEALAEEGLLDRTTLRADALPEGRVVYGRAIAHRRKYIDAAHKAFMRAGERGKLEAFRERERAWLEDFALFSALKDAHHGAPWTRWEAPLKDRRRAALEEARRTLDVAIDRVVFEQYAFDAAFRRLRRRAREKGIGLIGDVPIFVAHDSADVWQHRELFELDRAGEPTSVAGVPPDYFSRTGQRWGNPLYRWKKLARRGFSFWIERLEKTLERFDVVRLDHFIGFYRHWKIPASCPTAEIGRFTPGPRDALFEALRKKLGRLPFVAEDLGVVTEGVRKLRTRLGLPGIRVLQFAFGDDPQASTFLPHNYPRRCVATTGSHDNDTVMGWFRDESGSRSREQAELERSRALAYLDSDGRTFHWDMIRALSMSVARTVIFPAQDLLGLGSEARMNTPGTAEGNWEFRVQEGALTDELADRLAGITERYGREPRT